MSDECTQEHAERQKPTVLPDGRLKAMLWQNEGERGPYVSISVARTYTDEEGKPRDSRSFSVNDALRVSELLREASSVGRSMEKEMRRERQAERSQSETRSEQRPALRQNQEPSR